MRIEITLPFKNCELNRAFLLRFGLRVVKGFDAPTGEPTFRAGNAIECIHSKIRARIMFSDLEKNPKTSKVYRVITISNKTLDEATFQSLFYNFLDTKEGKEIADFMLKHV